MPDRPPSKKALSAELQRVCDNVALTRRMVTGMLLSGAAGAAAAQPRLERAPVQVGRSPAAELTYKPIATFKPRKLRVVRPDDMLILDVGLENLAVQGKTLVRVSPGQDARLVVEHQPQAIADQAFQEVLGQNKSIQTTKSGKPPATLDDQIKEPAPVPPNVAESRMAGRSRLVFLMPAGQNSHPWGLDGLLDACRTWPMALDSSAQPLPVESWTLSDASKALGLMQVHMDHAVAVLRANLPPGEESVLSQALPGASARVSAAINDAVRRGQPLSEGDIDQLIGGELDKALGAAGPQAANQRLLAGRLFEAAAVSMAIAAAVEPVPASGTPPTGTTTRRPGTAAPMRVTRPGLMVQSPPPPPAPPPPPGRGPAAFAPAAPAFMIPQRTAPPRPSPPPPPRTTFTPGQAFLPARPVQNLPPAVVASPPPPPAFQEVNPGVYKLLLKPHKPSEDVTALEIPYRLFQSPLATGGWSHALHAVTHGARTEIWHTRLGTRVASGVDDQSTEPLRAIWSWDYPENSKPDPYDPPPPSWALNAEDRRMLVRLTAGYDEKIYSKSNITWNEPGEAAYTPKPSLAKRLMLTALGGWLDLEGSWDPLPLANKAYSPDAFGKVDLQAWSHRTAMARDYYVRVVYAGFLFPFGHAASLVKVTERKFESVSDGGREAVLRQRYFIVVRETVRSYPGTNQAFGGNDFPFKQVELVTKITPNLAPPGSDAGDRVAPAGGKDFYANNPDRWREAFFPNTGSEDFQFRMVGVDGAGRRIPFSAPLFFMSIARNDATAIGDSATPCTIAYTYATSKAGSTLKSKIQMHGAVVQFAPQSVGGDANGDTNIPTDSITFHGAKPTSPFDLNKPQFHPGVTEADVVLPTVKHLLDLDKSPTVKFNQTFLTDGFGGANRGQVFLNLVTPVSLPNDKGSPTDRFGGMISPNMKPSALSRSFGTVAGAGNAAQFLTGNFKPSDFLPDAKLLGAVKLSDVLHAIDVLQHPDQAPKFANLDLPDRIEVGFDLSQGGLAKSELFVPSDTSQLKISAKTIIYRNSSPTKTTVDGSLNDFKINLFGFIILTFDNLSFHTQTGQKAEVHVDLNPDNGVLFGGPLEFVNTLKDFIPSSGFGDGSGLAVTPAGVSASYTLGLPDIGVGILSLQNISLGAGFSLPFTGEAPSAKFNFAERHNPFNLTVSLFGGGGFFAITIDTNGMKELEASLEFGASISIDLGVASGGVYVKGGFYFHWKDDPDNLVYFEGYVELGGHLSVLCLITASLTFHLGLAYEKSGTKTRLFGQATLSVEIDILFFSFSVGVHVEKQFAGSSDPRFIDFIPDDDTWRNKYCAAFA